MKISEGSRHIDAEVVPSQAVFLAGPHPTPFLTDFFYRSWSGLHVLYIRMAHGFHVVIRPAILDL